MSDDKEAKLTQALDDTAKKLAAKTVAQTKDIAEKLDKKKKLEKSKGSKEELKKIDLGINKSMQQIAKEVAAANANLNKRMLDLKITPEDEAKLKGLDKKAEGIISKNGLKIGKDMWVKPDVNLKKKKFGLKFTLKFK
ncbi:MAG: hypothetical protein AAFU49_12515 [Pseudomonadota bacterium]